MRYFLSLIWSLHCSSSLLTVDCGPAAPWSLTDWLSLSSQTSRSPSWTDSDWRAESWYLVESWELPQLQLSSSSHWLSFHVIIMQLSPQKIYSHVNPVKVAGLVLTGTKRDYHYLHVLLHWSWTLDTELWLRTTGRELGQGQDTMCVFNIPED